MKIVLAQFRSRASSMPTRTEEYIKIGTKQEDEENVCSYSSTRKVVMKFTCQNEPPVRFEPDSKEVQSDFRAMIDAVKTDCIISKTITSENLNLDYMKLFEKNLADYIFQLLEKEIVYDKTSQVKIFGKVHCVPRKQTSFGDKLSYKFSGTSMTARPWIQPLLNLKTVVERVTGFNFNFVLVNRYDSGEDHIGEHRDDETELAAGYPIASLSFGQHRDFIFRHKDSRGPKAVKRIEPIKLVLEHGSLLMMNQPTNKFWYHSIPKRSKKTAPNPRINLTFRKIIFR